MDFVKRIWNSLPEWSRNRYFITFFCFFVWISFFDSNNLIRQYKLRAKIRDLNRQELFLNNETVQDQKINSSLMNDKAALERFAREKYLMKRDCEDIFIVVEE